MHLYDYIKLFKLISRIHCIIKTLCEYRFLCKKYRHIIYKIADRVWLDITNDIEM